MTYHEVGVADVVLDETSAQNQLTSALGKHSMRVDFLQIYES